MNLSNKPNRTQWSNKIGFILAAAGSAIGLGNIWRFPYVTGTNGGGTFVIIYIFAILLIGIPLLIAEIYIGQKTQKNAVDAFKVLKGHNTVWQIIGWLGIVSAFLILSFYSVVGGWVLDYILKSIYGTFIGKSQNEIQILFKSLLNNPTNLLIWHTIFMGCTIGIVLLGVKKGIEKFSKILMPALFIILCFLLIWCMFLKGFTHSISFLFKPDFSKLSAQTIFLAVGQAFFSLSLGMGCMITYGSYINKQESDLIKISFWIAFLDTLVALLAGITIFSIVFSFNMEASSGPGLIFITLPYLFNSIPLGHLISIIFFILLFFAAITSSISLLEVVTAYFVDNITIHRKFISIIVGFQIFVIGVLCALSFNILANAKIFNKFTIFDFFDGITSNVFLPLGGILISIFFGWILGPQAIYQIFKKYSIYKIKFIKIIFIWTLRLLVPITIFIILIRGIKTWLNI